MKNDITHGVPEVVPPAKLVNGQWEGAPLSQFPELQEEVRTGLADGTLSVGGDGVPAVAPVRLVEGPPRDFGQAQDRYGEHMDRPAPGVAPSRGGEQP